ncbi:MAG: hypothetical protein K2N87_06125 [Eubacterium sp.]|nr:hypothetical protein [Eubacterium sp.]
MQKDCLVIGEACAGFGEGFAGESFLSAILPVHLPYKVLTYVSYRLRLFCSKFGTVPQADRDECAFIVQISCSDSAMVKKAWQQVMFFYVLAGFVCGNRCVIGRQGYEWRPCSCFVGSLHGFFVVISGRKLF